MSWQLQLGLVLDRIYGIYCNFPRTIAFCRKQTGGSNRNTGGTTISASFKSGSNFCHSSLTLNSVLYSLSWPQWQVISKTCTWPSSPTHPQAKESKWGLCQLSSMSSSIILSRKGNKQWIYLWNQWTPCELDLGQDSITWPHMTSV